MILAMLGVEKKIVHEQHLLSSTLTLHLGLPKSNNSKGFSVLESTVSFGGHAKSIFYRKEADSRFPKRHIIEPCFANTLIGLLFIESSSAGFITIIFRDNKSFKLITRV